MPIMNPESPGSLPWELCCPIFTPITKTTRYYIYQLYVGHYLEKLLYLMKILNQAVFHPFCCHIYKRYEITAGLIDSVQFMLNDFDLGKGGASMKTYPEVML